MNDPRWATRVVIGAGALGLAIMMTGCEGTAHGKKRPRSRATSSARSTTEQPLVCTDPPGDVLSAGQTGGNGAGGGGGASGRAPAWSDLTSVRTRTPASTGPTRSTGTRTTRPAKPTKTR